MKLKICGYKLNVVILLIFSLIVGIVFYIATSSTSPNDFNFIPSASSPTLAPPSDDNDFNSNGESKATGGKTVDSNNDDNSKHQNNNNNQNIPSTTESKNSRSSLIPVQSGGIYWPELGNVGWKKSTRAKSESLLSCPDARQHIAQIYSDTIKNVNVNAGPKFGMPWFFHGPYPICGSILLRHLHGSLDTVPVLRIGPNSRKGVDTDASLLSSSSSSDYNSLLLSPSFKTADREFQDLLGKLDPKTEVLNVKAGEEISPDSLFIEECGDGHGFSQVLYTARLVSFNTIVNAKITAGDAAANSNKKITFTCPLPGSYILEVKTVHANGTSDNPRVPRSLGVVGIRATIGGKKAFMYNHQCDFQRHIIGSPILIRAHPSSSSVSAKQLQQEVQQQQQLTKTSSSSSSSLCTRADHDSGFWIRMQKPELCHLSSNPYCAGDPGWVSDASAYNTQYVWVPTTSKSSSSTSSSVIVPACKFHYWTPPQGPAKSCLRFGEARAFLYLVGDSVMREYAKNCDLISLRSSKLQCLFANIALEGQHFSHSYAESVAKTIVTNVRENNAGVFATNLGLQHMIGPCTTKQWKIFIRYFVLYWKQQIVWQKGTSQQQQQQKKSDEIVNNVNDNAQQQETDPEINSLKIGNGLNNNSSTSEKDSSSSSLFTEEEKLKKFYFAPKYLRSKGEYPKLEQAVWIGPPTIQYARKGMGAERAALWDEIAWKELGPLGFIRMKTIPVTASRQEGTWDGLHYASEKGKVQTAWKNKNAKVYRWNGGVSNVLFTMLLNLICNR